MTANTMTPSYYNEFEGEYRLILIEDRYYLTTNKGYKVIAYTAVWPSRWTDLQILGMDLGDIECELHDNSSQYWY